MSDRDLIDKILNPQSIEDIIDTVPNAKDILGKGGTHNETRPTDNGRNAPDIAKRFKEYAEGGSDVPRKRRDPESVAHIKAAHLKIPRATNHTTQKLNPIQERREQRKQQLKEQAKDYFNKQYMLRVKKIDENFNK